MMIKKYTFFTLLYVLNFAINAQDSLKTKRFAVGFNLAPNYCNAIAYIGKNTATIIGGNVTGSLTYQVGLNLNYLLTKKILIETGVCFSQKGQKINIDELTWVTPTNNNQTPIYTQTASPAAAGTISKHSNTISYQYIEIPLKLNVILVNKRFKVYTSVGLSANIFIGKKTVYKSKTTTDVSRGFNAKNIPLVDVATLIGIGVSYDVFKTLSVKLEPNYKQFIRPLVDEPISGYLYSVGLNTGVNFRF